MNNNIIDTALIKTAIEYGRMQAFNEMPLPKQLKEYSSIQLSKTASHLWSIALDKGCIIEFDENGFKAIKPLEGGNDKEN